ncbi:glycoside hydrolase family 38 N-terminal domain-containing protein [Anaeromassilibacillus senegalensis]|uniref:glycoside hydrolase family 38 N-terminal domain-containing protein n=1 Tax=Anaeromassilibacillus senegalensis TaxID=1673717 RepID=UPI0006813F2E|nr:glycoside hydrolase family 38 C-terminal domain-containing protein [Anaeromassilibacillus senegalensis]
MKRKNLRKTVSLMLAAMLAVSAAAPTTMLAGPNEDAPSNAQIDSSWTMYLVPNAHIDTAWQWPYEDTARDVISDTFKRAIDNLKSNENYKFSMSASKHYEWTKEYYPEMYEDVKELIAKGQWDNPGGQVVEPDLNLPSGEALVRQSLEGQHFFLNEFNQMSTVGYVPDTFGFNGQFPQILKKSGMDNFVTTKLNWQQQNVQRDSDIFKWQSIDGSEVLSYAPMRDYVSTYNADAMMKAMKRNNQTGKETGVKKALGMFGNGDHGGGPNSGDYAAVVNTNGTDAINGASAELATITEYFDSVRETEDLSKVRTVEGEMYFENHRGTYTSWARVKEYNRKNEILAEKAEKAGTLGNWLGVLPGAGNDEVSKAWDKILINQFHDVLPGSSIPYQYQVTYNNQELAKNLLNNVQDNGLQAIAYKADTNVDGTPVLVFNSLSWARDDMVETIVSFDGAVPESLVVYDGDTELPSTVVARDTEKNTATIRFQAKDLPPVGFKVFNVKAGESAVETNLSAKEEDGLFVLENAALKVEIDKSTGNIAQIYNKNDNNRPVFADGYQGNEIHILKDTGGSAYPAWDLVMEEMNADPVAILNDAPESIEIVENSADKVVVRVARDWSDSTMYQDISLYPDTDRVDVKMHVSWNENQRMMKIAFPLAAESDHATYEIAYGALERPTTRDNSIDNAKFEVSGHKWADVTDDSGSYGTSILNDSKYGWDAIQLKDEEGNVEATRMRMTALRSPMGAGVRCSGWDPAAYYIDKTEHDFSYSIYPHSGTWQDANSDQKGSEFNYRTEAVQSEKHEGELGANHSFAASSADNVHLTVIKTPMENPDAKDQLIVRVYESQGKDNTDVTLTLPSNVKSAKEVNMIEFEDEDLNKDIAVNGNQISFQMDKYEITTIALEIEPYADESVALKSEAVDLYDYYNVDAVSFNEDRKDGSYDGKGNTIPAELWDDSVTFQGVDFQLGPKEDGYKNVVEARGQKIDLPKSNYKYVYLLGAAAGSGDKSDTFTVNMADGTSVTKEISFADWDSELSGWDRFSNSDLRPYVYDQVGHFFTHFHNGSKDRMTCDNYQFVYAIPVDPDVALDSIELPDARGIKITAISLADSDFLRVAREAVKKETITLPAVENVAAAMETGEGALGDKAVVSWDKADNIATYRVYRGTSSDFTLEEGTLAGTVSGKNGTFTDTLPYNGEFVYKVIGVDLNGNQTELSDVSNVVKGGLDNAFLNLSKDKISAPGGYNNEEPYRAFDGDEGTKWCFRQDGTYLQADLGENNGWTIDKFRLVNAGRERESYITRDFRIQTSDDGENWTEQVNVKNNKDDIVELVMEEPVQARYFKLIPDYAGQTESDKNCPRIYEFQAWGKSNKEVLPSAENATIAAYKDKEDDSKVVFEGGYTYINAGVTGVEGESTFQWYHSNDGETFAPIDGATESTLTMDKEDALKLNALKFEVTPVTVDGVEGEPINTTYIVSGDGVNVFQGKTTVADKQFNAGEAGSMITDGDLFTKWCADGVSEEDPRVAVIDLNGIYDLSKITLRHATAAVDEKLPGADERDRFKEYNTRKYNLYVSNDQKNWTLITAGENDDGLGVTEHTYDTGSVVGRYIKVEVTQGVAKNKDGSPYDGNSCVRLYEVLGYGTLTDFADKDSGGSNVPDTDITDVIPEDVKVVNTNGDRTPVAGDKLQASFTVEDEYRPYARYRWLISDAKDGVFTPVSGSYSEFLTVTKDMAGKFVRTTVRIDQGPVIYSNPIEISTEIDVPTEQNLVMTFPSNKARVAITGGDATIANLIGKYEAEILSGEDYEFVFTPRVEGREFAAISVNGTDVVFDEDTDTTSYTYTNAMGREDTELSFLFTVVNKMTLRDIIATADELKEGDEYAKAIPSVQKAFDSALKNAKDVEADKTAAQDSINNAWSKLLKSIHFLSFEKGDVTHLQTLLANADTLSEEDFTTETWAAFVEAFEAAQTVADDPDALVADVEKAYDDLYDAMMDLEAIADKASLNRTIEKADVVYENLDQYLDTGKEDFTSALEEAKKVYDAKNSTQAKVDEAETALVNAMMALRKIPNKDYLGELLDRVDNIDLSGYTNISVSALRAAYNLGMNAMKSNTATQEEVDSISELIETRINGLKKDTPKHNSSGGSSSSKPSINTDGEGTAVATPVVAAAQNIVSGASVRSDMTLPFTLKRGAAYCFKMTVNGTNEAPSFTVGNGDVLKTQYVAKIGNDYYYRVWAVGAPGQSTGVYTTLPGQQAVKHCTVTIG